MFAKCRIEIKASACWLDPRWLVTVTDRTWSKLTDDRSFSYPSSFSLLRNTTQKLLLLLRMSHCGHKTASQLFNPPGLVLFFLFLFHPSWKCLKLLRGHSLIRCLRRSSLNRVRYFQSWQVNGQRQKLKQLKRSQSIHVDQTVQTGISGWCRCIDSTRKTVKDSGISTKLLSVLRAAHFFVGGNNQCDGVCRVHCGWHATCFFLFRFYNFL